MPDEQSIFYATQQLTSRKHNLPHESGEEPF